MGWGGFLDKIMGQIPGRDERIRNQIDDLKREMDKLAREGIHNDRNRRQYDKCADRLRVLEQKAQNR